jgi:hypothetical protein
MNNLRGIVQSRPLDYETKGLWSAITRSVLHASRLDGFSHTKKVREVSLERRTLLAGMFSSSCFALTKRAAAYFDPMTPLQQRVQA